MQIHEITSRKHLNEIGIIGGLGQALANKFVSSTLGVNPTDQKYATGQSTDSRARGAMAINQQLAVLLGQQMSKAWTVAIQNFMKNHKDSAGQPLTSMKSSNPADADRLRQELNKMIMNSTKITTKDLDSWVTSIDTGDVSDKQEAKLIADNIKNLEAAIWKETIDPSDQGNARAKAFTDLGTAIAQAQNVNTFTAQAAKVSTPGSSRVTINPAGEFFVDGRPYDPKNPVHLRAVQDHFKNNKKS